MTLKSLVLLVSIVCTSQIMGQESSTVKLDIRTQSDYLKSGYSFRYRAQDISKHNNYVDLVYEAGKMRLNNQAGAESRIADLGEMDDIHQASKVKQSDAKWSQELIQPIAGRTYAMQIKEDRHQLVVVFHVKRVTDGYLEFEWQPVGSGKWGIPLNARAQAGTSGMISRSKERSRSSYPR